MTIQPYQSDNKTFIVTVTEIPNTPFWKKKNSHKSNWDEFNENHIKLFACMRVSRDMS